MHELTTLCGKSRAWTEAQAIDATVEYAMDQHDFDLLEQAVADEITLHVPDGVRQHRAGYARIDLNAPGDQRDCAGRRVSPDT
ncbi:MAG TPA: hypothetical protein VF848_04215 [Steroidobacteraceae bacterium]